MKTSPRVISFHYTLKNTQGEVIDSSSGSDPLSYLEGSGQIIPGLEEQLALLTVGDKRTVQVESVKAYGSHDANLIIEMPRKKLPKPEGIEVGDQFSGRSPDGQSENVFTVISLTEEMVTLDGNHPLAGEDLTFEVEITEVREATTDEIAHGHAHGPHGHLH